LRIGFIVTPDRYNYEPFRNQPLTALYLLTILEKHFGGKIDVSLIDLRGIEEKHLAYHIPEKDVYLYSVATPDFFEASNIVKLIRTIYPNAKHVAGGVHIMLFPKDSSKIFDTIIVGEGEQTVIELINDCFKSKVKLVYRQKEPANLDDYPYPDRKYLQKTAVAIKGLLFNDPQKLKGTGVMFSRGCPFNCYFCASKEVMLGPVRFRSYDLICEEIEYLKNEYDIEALAIKDENAIPLNTRIAKPFLEAIKKSDIRWRGQTRANGVNLDMVKLAKESGCDSLALGIESADQKVLGVINKKLDLEKAKKFIQLLNKNDINVRTHFILGLPGEPDDIVKKTIKFIDEADPSSVLLSLFCPMPGSKIFHYSEEFGIEIKNFNWDEYLTTFGRFDEDEEGAMTFIYKDGKGPSTKKILERYTELQAILRDKNLNY